MYHIQKADIGDCDVIENLIHRIYQPTYEGVLSQAQIDFMLEKNYTSEALVAAMGAGQDFFILHDEGTALGFIALQHKGMDILRIEKLYLLPDLQGKGLGKLLLGFAGNEAINRQKSRLELNVNRKNKAYYFYLKQGFHVIEEVDIPYYGFVLDDYVMQKIVSVSDLNND